jgi:OOP family OmpA-OmpF porin
MKKIIAAALLASAITTPAFAADQGGYFAVDYGTLSMTNAGLLPNPGAFDLIGGYSFNKNVSVEAGYMVVGDSTVEVVGFGSLTYAQSILHAAAVYSLPLNDTFEAYGKLGINSVSAKLTGTGGYAGTNASASTSNITYAIGCQYNFDQANGVRLQYESLGKTKAQSSATGADISRVSVGLIHKF